MNLIDGQLWHESYCWSAVARILSQTAGGCWGAVARVLGGCPQSHRGHPGSRIPLDKSPASVWAKPLTGNRLAVLAVSMTSAGLVDVNLDLAFIAPNFSCAGDEECAVFDVWQQTEAGQAKGGQYIVKGLASHDSAFLIFSSSRRGLGVPPLRIYILSGIESTKT